jgi:hypothetical protein
MDAPVRDVTVFPDNRERRRLEGAIARGFPRAIPVAPTVKRLPSTGHVSVEGTPSSRPGLRPGPEAWAGVKGFRPRDGGDEPPGRGRGAMASRTAVASGGGATRHTPRPPPPTPGPARLCRKARGQASKLCRMGHLPMEDRDGRPGRGHRDDARHRRRRARGGGGAAEARRRRGGGAAEAMIGDVAGCGRITGRITPGPDKAFAVAAQVAKPREMKVAPHAARNTTNRAPAIDGRATRRPGHGVSRRIRRRIEEASGRIKVPGGLRKARRRGRERAGWGSTSAAAACDPIRSPELPRA